MIDKPRFSLPIRLNHRVLLVALHDIVMAAVSLPLAIWLRFWIVDIDWSPLEAWQPTLIFAGVAGVVFQYTGLYRGIWHFASLRDMLAILRGSLLSLLIFVPMLFVFTRLADYPRSALVMQFFILMLLLAGPRILYRSWKDGSLATGLWRGEDRRIPVVLIGSSLAADTFIREMERSQASYRVVGIIDDSAGRHGRDLRGIRVLGRLDDLSTIVSGMREADRPRRIIVADDRLGGRTIRDLVDVAAQLGISVARLPRMTEFRKEGEASQVQSIDVEDLLGRPQRVLDRAAVMRLVAGRRILVTGAGGTIGSELVRQVAALEPAAIVLFEQSEHALYQIDMELSERFPAIPRVPVLGDVRDPDSVESVFAMQRPDIVLHAAAYKHVPLVEANVGEGLLTNVCGTQIVAQASQRHDVAVMVMISTDKAVNPTNVMGATKRIAEMICQSLDLERAAGRRNSTQYVTVRFGNVLGSSGSVVPLFQRQLSQGGPLTVTHPDVTRFFMTTREAVELILQAAAMPSDMVHAEGKIFVLDMGEPVRIQDLARQMIRLAGRQPDKDVKIVFTGLRPGEKLYEEVLHSAEATVPTPQEGVMLAAPRTIDRAELDRAIAGLIAHAQHRDTAALIAGIAALVPEFRHAPNGQASSQAAAPASAA
ncbi:MAG: polysaccharide biosynthesis protein [Ferrovibrio sp.]|uniref:polysaccharide biosynthesis protein n=1 Tax=Ferrovibrio sp. TaxID=1917215 RepID=UPI002637401C|nr:nucleoside-diphosphate sugar epimerase/dehydratase [Ferrovibrio sp.]MCW0232310.1 polysaccharide biosynthesis protein [Ferrovibrio sp.]